MVAVVTGYPRRRDRDMFVRRLLDWGYARAADPAAALKRDRTLPAVKPQPKKTSLQKNAVQKKPVQKNCATEKNGAEEGSGKKSAAAKTEKSELRDSGKEKSEFWSLSSKKKMKKTEKGFESPDFNVIVSGDSYFCFMNPRAGFSGSGSKGRNG